MTESYFVYMIACNDGTLYTGYAVDLGRRISLHNAGKASRYTRARLPVRLVYWEEHKTRQAAMRREAAIKRLTRQQKQAIIAAGENEQFADLKHAQDLTRRTAGGKGTSLPSVTNDD